MLKARKQTQSIQYDQIGQPIFSKSHQFSVSL